MHLSSAVWKENIIVFSRILASAFISETKLLNICLQVIQSTQSIFTTLFAKIGIMSLSCGFCTRFGGLP